MQDFSEMTQAAALEALASSDGEARAARAIAASIACGGQRVVIRGCYDSRVYLSGLASDEDYDGLLGTLTYESDHSKWCVRLEGMEND